MISSQSPKNTPPSVEKNCSSDSSQNTSAPGVKLCTVRLEILTEADIIRYVHVHQETQDSVVTDKTVETVETEETVYFTRSRTRPTPTCKNRLPRNVSNNIDNFDQEVQSDSGSSPTPKRK